MHYLFFSIGEKRFAIDVDTVIEVLPRVQTTSLPHAPEAIDGLMNFRGGVIPLLDLGRLLLGHPCLDRLSTRIILVRYPIGDGAVRPLGLLAENVLETGQCDVAEFVPTGVECADAPYLGPVRPDADGMVQWLRIERVLTDDLKSQLFKDEP